MHRLIALILIVSACKPDRPPEQPSPSPPTPAAPTLPATPDMAAAPVLPQFEGTPVAHTAGEVLHEHGAFVLLRQRWRFEETTGVAWFVRVPRAARVAISPSADVVPFPKLLPDDGGPWAAINGGFYEAIEESAAHRAMGLVIADGVVQSDLTVRGGSGVFYVDGDGPHIVHRKEFTAAPAQALQSIDRIIDGGKSVVSRRPGGAMRSAVVVGARYLWLVAAAADADIHGADTDIQLSRSGEGLPLWAFADYILETTDGVSALNLDGGVSTQIAVRDGDFRLDVRGVRGTINAVVVRPPAVADGPTTR